MDEPLTRRDTIFYILIAIAGLSGALVPFLGLAVMIILYFQKEKMFDNLSQTQNILFFTLLGALVLHFFVNAYLIIELAKEELENSSLLIFI